MNLRLIKQAFNKKENTESIYRGEARRKSQVITAEEYKKIAAANAEAKRKREKK